MDMCYSSDEDNYDDFDEDVLSDKENSVENSSDEGLNVDEDNDIERDVDANSGDDFGHEAALPKKMNSLYSGVNDIISSDGNSTRQILSCFSDDSDNGLSSKSSNMDVRNHISGDLLSFGIPQKTYSKSKLSLFGNKSPTSTSPMRDIKVHVIRAPVTSSVESKSSSSVCRSTGTGGIAVHKPVTSRKKDAVDVSHLSEELQKGYRIILDLMSDYHRNSNSVYLDAIDMDPVRNKEYLEVIKKPMWLRKIRDKLLRSDYNNITELIADVRLMLENAYRFYGPIHSFTKKGVRLEQVLEQKIALLPREFREKCSLEATSGQPVEEIKETHRNKTAKLSVNGDSYFSHILHRVKGCRAARDKDMKRQKMEALKLAKQNKELEIVHWDEQLLQTGDGALVANMWELPCIGQFLFLTNCILGIPEISQYELERILILPECSSSLCSLMSALLVSPLQRPKLSSGELPPMPYKVWVRKLSKRVMAWYKCYHREGRDPNRVYELQGIEPLFWSVCGPRNPLELQSFHKLTLHQRIWLLKTLCDHLLFTHKSMQDVFDNHNDADLREHLLGTDRHGFQYIYFPQFCGKSLRIYKSKPPPYDPEKMFPMNVEESVKKEEDAFTKEEVQNFRKMLRSLKKRLHQKDPEWEGARKPHVLKLYKRRGRPPKNPAARAAAAFTEEQRSRPSNLRQKPIKKYTQFVEDDPEDEFEMEPVRYKKQKMESDLSDPEDLTGIISSDEDGNPLPPLPARRVGRPRKGESRKRKKEEEDSAGDSCSERRSATISSSNTVTPDVTDSDATVQSSTSTTPLSRAKIRNPRLRKGGKRRHICEACGKHFTQLSALNGHMAVHTKERMKVYSSHEGSPVASRVPDTSCTGPLQLATSASSGPPTRTQTPEALAEEDQSEQPIQDELQKCCDEPPTHCCHSAASENEPPVKKHKGDDGDCVDNVQKKALANGLNAESSHCSNHVPYSLSVNSESHEDKMHSDLNLQRLHVSSETNGNGAEMVVDNETCIKEELFDTSLKDEPLFDGFPDTKIDTKKELLDVKASEIKMECKTEVEGKEQFGVKEESQDMVAEQTVSSESCSSSCTAQATVDNDSASSGSNSLDTRTNSLLRAVAEPLYDPSPYLPRLGEFELVVTSVEELRKLVLVFGPLPAKNSRAEAKKKDKVEEYDGDKPGRVEAESDENCDWASGLGDSAIGERNEQSKTDFVAEVMKDGDCMSDDCSRLAGSEKNEVKYENDQENLLNKEENFAKDDLCERDEQKIEDEDKASQNEEVNDPSDLYSERRRCRRDRNDDRDRMESLGTARVTRSDTRRKEMSDLTDLLPGLSGRASRELRKSGVNKKGDEGCSNGKRKCTTEQRSREECESESVDEWEQDEQSENEETSLDSSLRDEVLLHKALCRILVSLESWESKMLQTVKKERNKLRTDYMEWKKREPGFIDTAEEVWLTDPEPEPEPQPPPTPRDPTPSTSSSEDSYTEDGQRKRKLRKRRAKKPLPPSMLDNILPPPVKTDHLDGPGEAHGAGTTFAVSSRGRVRKVKQIINYDQMDFDKLALQAEKEAQQEKERKRKLQQEQLASATEQGKEAEHGESNNDDLAHSDLASNGTNVGIKTIFPSRSSGNISSLLAVHRSNGGDAGRSSHGTDENSRFISRFSNSACSVNGTVSTTGNVRTISRISAPVQVDINKVPEVIVKALHKDTSTTVMVKVVGDQALNIMRYMKPGTKYPQYEIKLQHSGSTYVVTTDAEVRTKNIPGVADSVDLLHATSDGTSCSAHQRIQQPVSSEGMLPVAQTQSSRNQIISKLTSAGGRKTVVVVNNNSRNSRINLPASSASPLAMTYIESKNSNLAPLKTGGLGALHDQPSARSGSILSRCSVGDSSTSLGQVASLRSDTIMVTATPSVLPAVAPLSMAAPRASTGMVYSTAGTAALNGATVPQQHVLTVSSAINTLVNNKSVVSDVMSGSHVVGTQKQIGQRILCVQPIQASPQPQVIQQVVQPQSSTANGPIMQVQYQTLGNKPMQLRVVSPANVTNAPNNNVTDMVEKTGGKVVAIPTGRGGYTLSITPSSGSQLQSNLSSLIDQIQTSPSSSLGADAIASSGLRVGAEGTIISSSVSNAGNVILGQHVLTATPQQQLVVVAGGNGAANPVIAAPGSGVSPLHAAPIGSLTSTPQKSVLANQPQQLVKTVAVAASVPSSPAQPGVVHQILQTANGQQILIAPQQLVRLPSAGGVAQRVMHIVQPGIASAAAAPVARIVDSKAVVAAASSLPQQQQPVVQQVIQGGQMVQQIIGGQLVQSVLQPSSVASGVSPQRIVQTTSSPQKIAGTFVQQQTQPQIMLLQQLPQGRQQVLQQPTVLGSSPAAVVNRTSSQQQLVLPQQLVTAQPQLLTSSITPLRGSVPQAIVQTPQRLVQAAPRVISHTPQQQVIVQPQQATSVQQMIVQQPAAASEQRELVGVPGRQATVVQTSQQASARLVLVQLPQGQRYALQSQDGSLTLLSQEQLSSLGIAINKPVKKDACSS